MRLLPKTRYILQFIITLEIRDGYFSTNPIIPFFCILTKNQSLIASQGLETNSLTNLPSKAEAGNWDSVINKLDYILQRERFFFIRVGGCPHSLLREKGINSKTNFLLSSTTHYIFHSAWLTLSLGERANQKAGKPLWERFCNGIQELGINNDAGP